MSWAKGEVRARMLLRNLFMHSNKLVPGIYGPGYDERRRERIKARYGIDVPAAVGGK